MKLTSTVNALLGKKKRTDDATFGESLQLEQIALTDGAPHTDDISSPVESEAMASQPKHASVLDLDFMAAPLAELEMNQTQSANDALDLTLSVSDEKQTKDVKPVSTTQSYPAPLVPLNLTKENNSHTGADTALAQVLRGSRDTCFIMFGPEGQFIESTENFCNITGISNMQKSTIKGYMDVVQLLSSDTEMADQNIEVLRQTKSNTMRQRLAKGLSKTYKSVETVRGKTLEISDIYTENHYLIIIIKDVSKQSKKESLRDEELRDLKELARNKSEFLARMSHEIRTPLNAIVGMTDALRDEVNNDEALKTTNFIADAAENLDNILSQTLEQERLSTSDIILVEETTNLRYIVQSTVAMWKKTCEDKGLELNVRIAPDLPKDVALDSSRFRQCLTNMLSNAVKFTESGSIIVAVAPMNLESDQPKILIAVRDTGIGMSSEALKNVFKPFKQGDASIQRRFGGSGLGMSITKHIVDAMDGHIKINSTEGAGATIAITIPLKLASAATHEPLVVSSTETTEDIKTEQLPAETFHPLKPNNEEGLAVVENDTEVRKNVAIIPSDYSGFDVLIVEDNPINQAVVKKLLTNHIQSMDFAFHGEEALELLETKAYDVILMDIHMPVKDGIETTLEIRNSGKAWADTVIVALTADPDYQQKRVCRNIGMNDALSKPVKRQELLDVMQRVLLERISKSQQKRTA